MHKDKKEEICEIEILPLADEDLQSVIGSLRSDADASYCSVWCCSNGCEQNAN